LGKYKFFKFNKVHIMGSMGHLLKFAENATFRH